ncbi:MAG: hypothetical protein WBL81_17230 [Pseudolabrys sp.]
MKRNRTAYGIEFRWTGKPQQQHENTPTMEAVTSYFQGAPVPDYDVVLERQSEHMSRWSAVLG